MTGRRDRCPRRPLGAAGAFVLTLLVGLVGMALPAGASAAGTITVIDSAGAGINITLDEVEGGQLPGGGRSLDAVLASASELSVQKAQNGNGAVVDTTAYVSAEVGCGSATVTLSKYQVSDPGAFPDGRPAFYDSGSSLRFVRPPGADGQGEFECTGSATVRLRSFKQSQLLSITAEALGSTTIKAGGTVKFQASASSKSGEPTTITWNFGDGSPSVTGTKAKHRFKKPGSFDVVVTVTTPGDRVGVSTTVRVQVGKVNESDKDRKGGGKSENGADSGPNDGAAAPGGGGTDSGGGTGTGSYTPSPSVPSSPSPTPSPPRSEPEPKPEKKPKPPVDDGLTPVEGELLDPSNFQVVQQAQAAPSGEVQQAREGQLQEADDQGGASIPGAALGIAGIAGLLALGGLLELRFSARLS